MFQTVLWDTVKAAEIATPGGLLDCDMEMKPCMDVKKLIFRCVETVIWAVKIK